MPSFHVIFFYNYNMQLAKIERKEEGMIIKKENGKLSLKESCEVFIFLFLMNDKCWERLLLADGEIQ